MTLSETNARPTVPGAASQAWLSRPFQGHTHHYTKSVTSILDGYITAWKPEEAA